MGTFISELDSSNSFSDSDQLVVEQADKTVKMSLHQLKSMAGLHVDSIASLKARDTSSIAEDTPVNVLGYHEAGDGGGGIFYWDAASTDADDGGTIIEPDVGGTGRWAREMDGKINVKWFGAKGSPANNKVDDTTPIYNAVVYGISNIVEVYFPNPGTGSYYFVNLHLTNGETKFRVGNISWVGDENQSRIAPYDESKLTIKIYADGYSTSHKFRNLIIWGGWRYIGLAYSTFTNCIFRFNFGNNQSLYQGPNIAFDASANFGCTYNDCRFGDFYDNYGYLGIGTGYGYAAEWAYCGWHTFNSCQFKAAKVAYYIDNESSPVGNGEGCIHNRSDWEAIFGLNIVVANNNLTPDNFINCWWEGVQLYATGSFSLNLDNFDYTQYSDNDIFEQVRTVDNIEYVISCGLNYPATEADANGAIHFKNTHAQRLDGTRSEWFLEIKQTDLANNIGKLVDVNNPTKEYTIIENYKAGHTEVDITDLSTLFTYDDDIYPWSYDPTGLDSQNGILKTPISGNYIYALGEGDGIIGNGKVAKVKMQGRNHGWCIYGHCDIRMSHITNDSYIYAHPDTPNSNRIIKAERGDFWGRHVFEAEVEVMDGYHSYPDASTIVSLCDQKSGVVYDDNFVNEWPDINMQNGHGLRLSNGSTFEIVEGIGSGITGRSYKITLEPQGALCLEDSDRKVHGKGMPNAGSFSISAVNSSENNTRLVYSQPDNPSDYLDNPKDSNVLGPIILEDRFKTYQTLSGRQGSWYGLYNGNDETISFYLTDIQFYFANVSSDDGLRRKITEFVNSANYCGNGCEKDIVRYYRKYNDGIASTFHQLNVHLRHVTPSKLAKNFNNYIDRTIEERDIFTGIPLGDRLKLGPAINNGGFTDWTDNNTLNTANWTYEIAGSNYTAANITTEKLTNTPYGNGLRLKTSDIVIDPSYSDPNTEHIQDAIYLKQENIAYSDWFKNVKITNLTADGVSLKYYLQSTAVPYDDTVGYMVKINDVTQSADSFTINKEDNSVTFDIPPSNGASIKITDNAAGGRKTFCFMALVRCNEEGGNLLLNIHESKVWGETIATYKRSQGKWVWIFELLKTGTHVSQTDFLLSTNNTTWDIAAMHVIDYDRENFSKQY